jgi:hypothetical protein
MKRRSFLGLLGVSPILPALPLEQEIKQRAEKIADAPRERSYRLLCSTSMVFYTCASFAADGLDFKLMTITDEHRNRLERLRAQRPLPLP